MPGPRFCDPCSPEQSAILAARDTWNRVSEGSFVVAPVTCVALAVWDEVRGTCTFRHLVQFAPTALILIVQASNAITELIMYIGLPTWLTFGQEIGGFLPRRCEEMKTLVGARHYWACAVKKNGVGTVVLRWLWFDLRLLAGVAVVFVPFIRYYQKQAAQNKVREERRKLAEAIEEGILTMREEQALLEDGKAMEMLA